MKPRSIPEVAQPLPRLSGRMQAYLYLLKKTLIRYPLLAAEEAMVQALSDMDEDLTREIRRWALTSRAGTAATPGVLPLLRAFGMDWPADAETMVGLVRLASLQRCVTEVVEREVPGDLAEAGVWRGGASILMRAVLRAYGDTDRCVWLADSFHGLPVPDPINYPADQGDDLWTYPQLAISEETVKANFERYGLFDSRVRLLAGWFRHTLPSAPIERLAILRLDGDMYESTITALQSLYHKLSPGGYVVVDDYGAVPACRAAVEAFRSAKRIHAPLQAIDWTGVYWQVPGP